jgi:hypothetical protein
MQGSQLEMANEWGVARIPPNKHATCLSLERARTASTLAMAAGACRENEYQGFWGGRACCWPCWTWGGTGQVAAGRENARARLPVTAPNFPCARTPCLNPACILWVAFPLCQVRTLAHFGRFFRDFSIPDLSFDYFAHFNRLCHFSKEKRTVLPMIPIAYANCVVGRCMGLRLPQRHGRDGKRQEFREDDTPPVYL